MKRIAQLESQYMRDIPPFGAGDTVRVHYKIKEGDKERIQVFQGTVISRRGSGTGKTFTVRKISSGIGVERVFPLHSPNIAKIERTAIGRVRRAKLYYLRGLTGKSARIKEKLGEKAEKENAKAAKAEKKKVKAAKAKAAEAPKPKAAPKAPPAAPPKPEKAKADPAADAVNDLVSKGGMSKAVATRVIKDYKAALMILAKPKTFQPIFDRYEKAVDPTGK